MREETTCAGYWVITGFLNLQKFTVSHSKLKFKINVGERKRGVEVKDLCACKNSLESFSKSSHKMRTQEHPANKGLFFFFFQITENVCFYICNFVFQHFYWPSASQNCSSLSGVRKKPMQHLLKPRNLHSMKSSTATISLFDSLSWNEEDWKRH